jgi:hypothetical protein
MARDKVRNIRAVLVLAALVKDRLIGIPSCYFLHFDILPALKHEDSLYRGLMSETGSEL